MTGRDLTLEQVEAVARHDARVSLSAEAAARSRDAYGLLLEGAAEGIPIYWFNRGVGDQRETVIFAGDPTSPANQPALAARQLATFRDGVRQGYGPELADEATVRAIMAIRANMMTYEAASPDLSRMLPALLNAHVTPVVQSRGTVGEGDLATLANIGAAMVGTGDAYYRGKRMRATEALRAAGIAPLQPFGADDSALTSSNAYALARAALLLVDAKRVLDWADLIYAMDLEGMNSSVTPLARPVQANRPSAWPNWDAARVLAMVRGSALLADDPARIIQDPESMRASSQRQGAAWKAWAALRDDVVQAMNASDHNPAILVGRGADESWELATPQFQKYFVKGGPLSHGQHGFILSNANWDPYPLANDIEAFSIAMANMDVAVAQRIQRFADPFFTVLRAADVVPPDRLAAAPVVEDDYLAADLWQEIAAQAAPVSPEGNALYATVEDLQAATRLKLDRAGHIVETSLHLLAQDILTGAFWMDVRRTHDPGRPFGIATGPALAGFRAAVPWPATLSDRRPTPAAAAAYDFLAATDPATFLPAGETGRPPPRP